jgi:DNA-binding response OmpR family regulator
MVDILAPLLADSVRDGEPLFADSSGFEPGMARDRPRLLLIDDEPSVARFLAHAAEENGFEAKITISAENFCKAYEEEEPDVIAVDLAMPGGDGIELLRYLAERKSEAIVVIVSGFDSRVLEAAMRLGEGLGLRMAGPLHKPMRVADLMEAIRAAPPRVDA